MQRRTFLQRLTFGSGVLAAAAAPYGLMRLLAPQTEVPRQRHLPLPGALVDHQAFLDACIGCGLCAEVCPPRCVKFDQRQGGGAVNTPYIDPLDRACILCGKCMAVCPTAALTRTPIDQVDMGIAQIDRTACYPWVDRGVCGACANICPLGTRAIDFAFANMYRPVVKAGCVGCGQCVEVCPHPSKPIRIVRRGEGTITRHRV